MDFSPNTILAIGLAVAVVVWMVFRSRKNAARSALAHKAVEAGAKLIDVRTPAEFASGHLPGAVNIPMQELGRRMKEAGKKDRPVVVYCQSGSRSVVAKQLLETSGFKEVINLGSIRAW